MELEERAVVLLQRYHLHIKIYIQLFRNVSHSIAQYLKFVMYSWVLSGNVLTICPISLLLRLPSGWPAFSNCNVFHTIGITLAVIVIFISGNLADIRWLYIGGHTCLFDQIWLYYFNCNISAYAVLCVGVCKMFRVCKREPPSPSGSQCDVMHDLILVEKWWTVQISPRLPELSAYLTKIWSSAKHFDFL